MARRRGKKAVGATPAAPAGMVEWALAGLEVEIARLRQQLAELTAQANLLRREGRAAATPGTGNPALGRPRRTLSAAGRRRISEMMKKRWAAKRAAAKRGAAKKASAKKKS